MPRQLLPADKPRTLVLPPIPYALAIVGGWWLDRHWRGLGLHLGEMQELLAFASIFGGLMLMLWAVLTFRQHRTTVNPYKAATQLCTAGPFRFSRNPIYVGDWMLLLGFSLWFETLWPLAFSPIVWGIIRYGVIRHEEAHLETKFGDAYRQYRDKVPRWI